MLKVGVIGAGFFGEVHAKAISEVNGVEIVAATRSDKDAAQAYCNTYGGKAYTDYRDLLADDTVNTVLIATPHHHHEAIAIAAAKAGKHIMLEKPMAQSYANCISVNAAVSENGVKLFVGHVMHFALPMLKAKEIIDSGELGKPVVGSSWMIKLWMESNRRDWHLKQNTGGGMLMTAGIHALDRMMWIMDSKVTGVSAMTGAYFHDQEADDTALLGLRFENGNIGQVQSIGYRNGAMRSAMDLICENGSLHIDFDKGVYIGRDTKLTHIENSIEDNWMQKAVSREWESLLHSVEHNLPTAVDGDYAAHVVAVVDAAHKSSQERREIAL